MKTIEILNRLATLEDVTVGIERGGYYLGNTWGVHFTYKGNGIEVSVEVKNEDFATAVTDAWAKFEKSISKGLGNVLCPVLPKPDDYRD